MLKEKEKLTLGLQIKYLYFAPPSFQKRKKYGYL
jgi:hypothetical protein